MLKKHDSEGDLNVINKPWSSQNTVEQEHLQQQHLHSTNVCVFGRDLVHPTRDAPVPRNFPRLEHTAAAAVEL